MLLYVASCQLNVFLEIYVSKKSSEIVFFQKNQPNSLKKYLLKIFSKAASFRSSIFLKLFCSLFSNILLKGLMMSQFILTLFY